MPCRAWNKELKVNIFQRCLEHRFCKSACNTSDHKTPSTWLALQTLLYPLNGKAREFPTRSVGARQVGLVFKQCSCSSEWPSPTLRYLLLFTVGRNTHAALVRLKCITSHTVLDCWKNQSFGQVVTETTLGFSLHKKNNPNSILLKGVNTSLSNTMAYVKHVTLRNYTICTWILFYSLSLPYLPRDSLHSRKSYNQKVQKTCMRN